MNFRLLLVSFGLLLVNFGLLLVSFGHFTREFGDFTREFMALLVNSLSDFTREFMRSRKFGAFTCEFLSFLLGETSNTSCLYLFFFNIPVRIKETKKDRIPFYKRNPVFFNYKLFCSAVTFCNFIPVYNIPERIDVFRTAVLVV